MLAPVFILSTLGLVLGLLLGLAARVFAVEADDLAVELAAMMPGTNCGQCGLAGCAAAADALAAGNAPATVCPGGGAALAQAIAARLGIPLDMAGIADQGPRLAAIQEEICIGCCRCLRSCATDAILGASKQIHGVLHEACTGCGACVETCPTGAIGLQAKPKTLQDWNWALPAFA
ncbi:RnfABCDGE type electron transport complex subunit B [Niveibacterium sp.]|uniref:RnfABCDGE type electron transport complex subunit B n=1 Tax=Niveibacterium sp. TaxID=2017444 RepID=UPI0035B4C7AD